MKKKFLLLFLALSVCSTVIPVTASESYETGEFQNAGEETAAQPEPDASADSELPDPGDTASDESTAPLMEDTGGTDSQNAEESFDAETGAETPDPGQEDAAEIYEEASEDISYRAGTEAELRALIESAPADTDTTIIITSNLIISDTIQIPREKTIQLITENSETEITRADGFFGELFDVSGTLSVTNDANPNCVLKLTGSASEAGSLIKVKPEASFFMDDTLVLSGNNAEAGGAIYNQGHLVIRGGRIVQNCAEHGGAIYSEGSIVLSGSPYIYENTRTEDARDDNIGLNGDDAVLELKDDFSSEAKVGVHALDSFEDRTILLSFDGTAETLQAILNDDEEHTVLAADGRLKYRPELTKVSDPVWLNASTVSFTCVSSQDGYMYSTICDSDAEVPVFDLSEDGQRVLKGEAFTVEFRGVDSTEAQTIYILVKGDNQALSRKKSEELDMSARPTSPTPESSPSPVPTKSPTNTPTPTAAQQNPGSSAGTEEGTADITPAAPTPTTRAAIVSNINDSVVTGLESPLKMIPNTFYRFTVAGAGTSSASPLPDPNVEGDTRYIPAYWMLEGGRTKQTQWKIGAPKGINEKRTFPIRIYFQRQVYKDGHWTADGEEYLTYNVETEPYNELTVTPGADSTYISGAGEETTDLLTAAPGEGEAAAVGGRTSENAKTEDSTKADVLLLLLLISVTVVTIVLLLRGHEESNEEE